MAYGHFYFVKAVYASLLKIKIDSYAKQYTKGAGFRA